MYPLEVRTVQGRCYVAIQSPRARPKSTHGEFCTGLLARNMLFQHAVGVWLIKARHAETERDAGDV